jgi:hypothetical protein
MAMEDIGTLVIDLSCPGWRITPENVSSMCQQLSTVLAEKYEGDTLILYQLLDNSLLQLTGTRSGGYLLRPYPYCVGGGGC